MSNEIEIVISGGCVQDIVGLPHGYTIVIKDYDIEGMESDRCKEDEDGDVYEELIWGNH